MLTIIFLSSCKSTPDLTENEVYTIINEIIVDDSLPIYQACWKFKNIQLTEKYKKEFTEEDLNFIEDQNEIFKNLKIKPNQLKWYKRRQKEFEFTTVDTICDQGILYHISFPIISADRKKVLIEFQEDCNCLLGGQGGKDLYEKKNGHWIRTKSFDQWISQSKNLKLNTNKT
ncbi:hypothetical protein EAH81_26860 [Flavobacterium pectinovorum]|uniref:Uncharacterized protein n=2 Tax=Flavobacterium pectinovorum TaxID=29533 RepID=A0A502E4J2_9FLAO|nr:hypothetical protein EAH81_26860 [Flavobacterium pectinovorum]